MKTCHMMNEMIVKKLFKNSRIGKELTSRIIGELLGINYMEIYNNIIPAFEEIGFNSNIINSTTDLMTETDKIYVNVEINRFNGPNKDNEMQSYVYQVYLKQIRTYKDYKHIKNVIQIMIEDYDYFNKNQLVYDVVYMEKNLHIIEDETIQKFRINLSYIEQMNYKNIINSKNELIKLLYFLICEDDMKLNEMYGGDEFMCDVVKETKDIASFLNTPIFPYTDEEVLEMDKKYFIEQGIQQNKQEMILNMHKLNLPLETIASCANLTVEEVSKIINNK